MDGGNGKLDRPEILADVVMAKCEDIRQMADNTRILHDYAAYKNALADYQYTKYKFENTGESQWETKYNELKNLVGGGSAGGNLPTP